MAEEVSTRTSMWHMFRVHKYPCTCMILMDFFSSLKIYFLRLVSNILVLGLLGGSGYLIYFVAQQEPDESDIDLDEGIEDLAKDIYERYRASFCLKLFILLTL